jgi:diguanylate cyclase (GGDEF)-like protein
MDVYQKLLDEESIRGERVAWIFRWILYGVVSGLAAVVFFYQGHRAGLYGMLLSAVPVVYNLVLWPMIRQRKTYPWVRYLSVTIDVMGLTFYNAVDTIFTTPFVPATTAALLLYAPVIFLASLRLDRRLIVYATALSVVTMNALFACAYPRFDPAIASRIVSADVPGQVYRTLYVVLAGLLMLFVPGTISRLLKNQRDVYENYLESERLSMSDNLTGIANRRALEPWFARNIASAAHSGSALAVAYVDLDRFKPINDEWGHDAGDAVLREVASRLKEAVRDKDLVARVGGDEFVVALTVDESETGRRSIAETLSARIVESVARPIAVGDAVVTVGVSAGVAVYPDDGASMKRLIELADGRMLERKRGAR